MKFSRMWVPAWFATAMVLGGCDSGASKAPELPPVSVNTYTVQEGEAIFSETYPGTVTAINQVDVRPQVAGYISGIYFTEGQLVSKGQKLYSIDPQQFQGAYQQAQANLEVAKANLAKAQQDAERYEELAKQDAIAKQVLDHSRADLQASQRSVEAAQANVSAVETNLKYTNIYAPFAGRIGISQVKMGAAVNPGQTIMNTISSDDPMGVDIQLDEKQIPRFNALEKQPIKESDSLFTLIMADQSVYPYPGKILLIDRAVDPQTGTIRVRMAFPNVGYALRPGMSCNLKVKNNAVLRALMIPQKSVVEQMGEFFVFVINDSSKVNQRKIQLGARIKENVVVRSGLQLGEKIITDGVQKLREGSKIVEAPSKPGEGKDSAKAGK